jgi:chromosomal replication initiation ATPase DnaA
MICTRCKRTMLDEQKAPIFQDAQQIISRACMAIGLQYKDIKKRSRRPQLVEGRMILAHVLYSNPALGLALADVAELIGLGDHTTIIHLLKKLENFCSVYPEYKQKLEYVHEKTYESLVFCKI